MLLCSCLLYTSIDDPYRIWLSEVILQQTRIDQGTSYYLRFVEHYPTVSDLAAAQMCIRDRPLRGIAGSVATVLLLLGWGIFVGGNLRHLPLIDFRPYKIGASLRELTMIPEDALSLIHI